MLQYCGIEKGKKSNFYGQHTNGISKNIMYLQSAKLPMKVQQDTCLSPYLESVGYII